MSVNKVSVVDVDSLGFSKKYPKYYFDNKATNKKIDETFTMPKDKLNIWIPMKANDTEKYNFIYYSSLKNGYELFISGNYHFLNKYCFSFIECFDNNDIYYVCVTERSKQNIKLL